MNKLSYREYLLIIANTMTSFYGDSLMDDNVDLMLAGEVLETLKRYLYFHPLEMSKEQFLEERIDMLAEHGYCDEEDSEQIAKESWKTIEKWKL